MLNVGRGCDVIVNCSQLGDTACVTLLLDCERLIGALVLRESLLGFGVDEEEDEAENVEETLPQENSSLADVCNLDEGFVGLGDVRECVSMSCCLNLAASA